MTNEFSQLLTQVELGKTDGLDECSEACKLMGASIEHFEIVVSKAKWFELELLRDCVDFLVSSWNFKLRLR